MTESLIDGLRQRECWGPVTHQRCGLRPATRAKAHGQRAIPRWLASLGLALPLTLTGCGGKPAGAEPASDATPPTNAAGLAPWTGGIEIPAQATAQVQDLIRKLTPLRPDLTSDHHDRWFREKRELMTALRASGDKNLGIAAMRAYAEYTGEETLVREGLLDVAAHTAPQEAQALLETLMLEYGYPIDDRTYATLFLAATSPERYLEVAKPYVTRRGRPTKTMPNDEFLVQGWIRACEETGRSPVAELADVATNLMMEDAARHLATAELGNHKDPVGRKALETLIVESTGNSYIRRKAAQSLRASLPEETACTLFRYVLANEADGNFRSFLNDLIALACR